MLILLELLITPTEKPDKSLDVKEAAQSSYSPSSLSKAEQERQSSKKQEEKKETTAVQPPKAKEARRFVYYQGSDGILTVNIGKKIGKCHTIFPVGSQDCLLSNIEQYMFAWF